MEEGAHVILVPPTLVGQWEKELRFFFLPHAVDIFSYTGGAAKHREFFGRGGPWEASKMPLSHRIIIASHSVGFIYLKTGFFVLNYVVSRPFELMSKQHCLAVTSYPHGKHLRW
jgi:hypothetical protein